MAIRDRTGMVFEFLYKYLITKAEDAASSENRA
jgi:hypothetical protein